jgi:uncharacterized membrane protein YjjB (DUF3815 family)
LSYHPHMFNVSGRGLAVLLLIAIAQYVVGMWTDVGVSGRVLAIILGAYVITTSFVRIRRVRTQGTGTA